MDTSSMTEPRSSTEHLEVHNEVAQVGIWGTKSKGSEQNRWSFLLENNHKLKKITIDHGDLIYSLMCTTEDGRGCLHDSEKAGGWNGGSTVTEVTFDLDEEIIGIDGTVGVSTGKYAGYTIISSLSFLTNKRTHGPFGKATGTPFSVPWNEGSFAGFYGLAGYYIDGIGIYLKASQETAWVGLWGTESSTGPQWSFCFEKNHELKKITIDHEDMISSLIFTSEDCKGFLHVSNKSGGYNDGSTIYEVRKKVAQVGIWGTKSKGSEKNRWSFLLENNHKLKKITIDHGDLIYSLMYTTEDGRGCLHDSEKAGGWNGGSTVSEVTFDLDEEIIGIDGTVGVSTGEYAGYTIISSLSFLTNKRTHGPFGKATGTPFSVPWSKGSFAGFYGLAGYYIDGIGVYLKASQETAQVGLWGTKSSTGPQYRWSFCLEKSLQLTKITDDADAVGPNDFGLGRVPGSSGPTGEESPTEGSG